MLSRIIILLITILLWISGLKTGTSIWLSVIESVMIVAAGYDLIHCYKVVSSVKIEFIERESEDDEDGEL